MARRKAAKSKRDRVAKAAPVASPRKPRRPATPTWSKAKTPATTRGGVKAAKSRKIGARVLSQLPPRKRHEPLSAILWERGKRLAATRHATSRPAPLPRAVPPANSPPPQRDRKLAAQFAMLARRSRRAAAEENRDGSWNLRLDYFPTDPETTVQLRDFEAAEDRERERSRPRRERARRR